MAVIDITELELHRAALTGHCYRMLGSAFDAEDAVQEAMVRAWKGLNRFDGRASLKTWILRIVIDTAETRGVREAHSLPFAPLDPDEPAVDPGRFRGRDDRYPGGWRVFPADWQRLPGDTLDQLDALDVIGSTIASLPPEQRAVIHMRDIEGCSAEEVCAALDVTLENQRVLLHRARSRVRSAVEQHLP